MHRIPSRGVEGQLESEEQDRGLVGAMIVHETIKGAARLLRFVLLLLLVRPVVLAFAEWIGRQ